MTMLLARNWWALAVRGVFAIALGLVALLAPDFALLWLVLVFGVYALLDGAFAIASGLRAAKRNERWWPFALEGLANIFAAVVAFALPAAVAFVFLYVVSAWALLTGFLRIAAAIRLRRSIRGEWLLLLHGALSVVLGILLIRHPAAGLRTLVWALGAYAVFLGIVLLALSLRLRVYRHRPSGAIRAR
jgi:uncharacterized membrane protein HdeD (DUF308 family)